MQLPIVRRNIRTANTMKNVSSSSINIRKLIIEGEGGKHYEMLEKGA